LYTNDTITSTPLSEALDYYAAHGASLFPIPHGQKAPFGIVASFKHDHSNDRKQWQKWVIDNPGCNFGVVAFASDWIIADIDTSGGEAGETEAWAAWTELCTSWGLPGPLPAHVRSQSGGFHVYFQVPPHIDAATLRQPDAIKGRINIRCVGYTVAAGSQFEGRPYTLISATPPHPAPDALVKHCTRKPRPLSNSVPGSFDNGDVAALLRWMAEKDLFASYEDWLQAGMALKIHGDDGSLWDICHDGSMTPSEAAAKFESFAGEPTADSVTLTSLMKRAHAAGWTGNVRPSTASMFDGVAALAAAAGAGLHSGMPVPPSAAQGVPMLAGQEELVRLGVPILAEFLDATKDVSAPISDEWPTLPVAMSGHGLYEPMVACITRIVAMSEPPAKFKPARVTAALAVLNVLHADVFEALCRRLRTFGHTLHDKKTRLAAANLSEKVERITVGDKWIYDARSGLPENDNSDNCAVLLGVLGLDLRWNAWLEKMEIQGGIDADLRWPVWTYVDDTVVAKLRTRANRTKTRFRPGKEFFWESLLALSHANTVDPVLELLADLESKWDGVPRLDSWMTTYCHAPDDAYHRAVGRDTIGGMVSRARSPGVKHDTMPIFFGAQGTGKSTMAKILALDPKWFVDSILLGDASKELVLSLAGKLVVEIGEMGTRGNTDVNHVKAMISRQNDEARTAYARAVTSRDRRNIFIGTANDESWPMTFSKT
jgi:hypothetical protein